MEKFTKKLGDDEVKNKYIMLPHGKEKLFPKDDFEVEYAKEKFTAYVYPFEGKSQGSKKIWDHKLMFRDPTPDLFHFGKTVIFTKEDDNKITIELI